MPDLEYFVVSDSVSIDASTNTISLFHVLEDVHPAGLPVAFSLTAVSSRNVTDAERGKEVQVTLVVACPGQEPQRFPANVTLNHSRFRVITRIEGLVVQQHGIIKMEVLLDGKHSAGHRLVVHPPTPEGAPATKA